MIVLADHDRSSGKAPIWCAGYVVAGRRRRYGSARRSWSADVPLLPRLVQEGCKINSPLIGRSGCIPWPAGAREPSSSDLYGYAPSSSSVGGAARESAAPEPTRVRSAGVSPTDGRRLPVGLPPALHPRRFIGSGIGQERGRCRLRLSRSRARPRLCPGRGAHLLGLGDVGLGRPRRARAS